MNPKLSISYSFRVPEVSPLGIVHGSVDGWYDVSAWYIIGYSGPQLRRGIQGWVTSSGEGPYGDHQGDK